LSRFCLEDRVAVVTGAGSGIGEGIALGFAGVGAHIVVAELDASKGEVTAGKVRVLGRKALPIVVDVTLGDKVQGMVDKALAEFGRIDILVNNVGGMHGRIAPLLEMPEAMMDEVLKRNLKGTFLCSKIVGRVMTDQKRGNITNISSGATLQPYLQNVVYCAAKAGIINFTRASAVYLAPYNIRVNCIAPGHTAIVGSAQRLPMFSGQQRAGRDGVPLGRSGYPEDMAYAAIYLASDAASCVTSIVISVDGGPPLGNIILENAEEVWKKVSGY
jgi:NAD(P)-dependent dehydrogenase (short-subunit alcohol dehydrogenase family)